MFLFLIKEKLPGNGIASTETYSSFACWLAILVSDPIKPSEMELITL